MASEREGKLKKSVQNVIRLYVSAVSHVGESAYAWMELSSSPPTGEPPRPHCPSSGFLSLQILSGSPVSSLPLHRTCIEVRNAFPGTTKADQMKLNVPRSKGLSSTAEVDANQWHTFAAEPGRFVESVCGGRREPGSYPYPYPRSLRRSRRPSQSGMREGWQACRSRQKQRLWLLSHLPHNPSNHRAEYRAGFRQ